MSNILLEKIEEKQNSIRKTAQEYFALNQAKSAAMESHEADGREYNPVRGFSKTIPYRDFEKIISG